ncbi:MAG: hypothetical protein DRM99_03535 [Thermoplasmata archaeon]|nr:MAG: hypothetical protein DRM99_03535 [Thermoplasmata archaeon]
MLEKILKKIKFPKQRIYPIALATFLMYLAWHPLGDFIESLIIGWRIIPEELFTWHFWQWWVPFAQAFQHSYTFAFFAYFIPITLISYFWLFLHKKFKLNKYLIFFIIAIVTILTFAPQLIPEKSVAYQNDIQGFEAHGMQPLNLWMYFHIGFWFLWMIFPHLLGLFTTEKTMLKISGITWLIFLVIWITTCLAGRFIYVPIIQ